MDLDDALQTFIAESGELLEDMEGALLAIHAGAPDAETVNAIFRAAHTIKGSAGLFGLDHVVAFTHVAESVLDLVRAAPGMLDAELVGLLLACRDHLGQLVGAVRDGGAAPDPQLEQAGRPLVAALQRYLAPAAAAAPTAAPAPPGAGWHIAIVFGPTVLQNGMDPLAFLRYLGTVGRVEHVVTHAALPPLAEMDAEACYLAFDIDLDSAAAQGEIEAVFEFVRDDCQLAVTPRAGVAEAAIRRIEADEPQAGGKIGETLLRAGVVTRDQLATALRVQVEAEQPAQIGQILVAQGVVEPSVVEAAAARQSRAREPRHADAGSIRVDADKLDHLINLVGELIIATASANLVARRARNPQFQECSATLSSLVEDVRNSALQLRMVKIGATFNRFQRVVHDVSRELNKQIELQVSGEDTELDKTVVEKIADPLTHLVRNAMDHGIEPAAVRAARGKNQAGTIGLHACHDSGTIVIEVTDDGGGLNRERILAKAIERGLVDPGKPLADEDVFALVFEPGFSTAEQVTNLSGRGVGMDVVKRNITAMRGSVHIASREGVGTTVTVRLPLTLAIINGFQVGVGRTVFVVPLDMVEECVEYRALTGHDVADLRGQMLPLIRLRQRFGVAGTAGPRQSVVVVRHAGQRVGLVVDTLLGESQTVIKPLGKIFQRLECISGSSILGSGEVALILDVPALMGSVPALDVALH